MRLTWDPAKNERNLRDHGVDFEDAQQIFDGPTVEFPDDAHSTSEARMRAVGLMYGIEITVIYTDDAPGVRHLISARKATEHERQAFYREVGGR